MLIIPDPLPAEGYRKLSPPEILQRQRALTCIRSKDVAPCQGQVFATRFFDGTGNNPSSTAASHVAVNHAKRSRLRLLTRLMSMLFLAVLLAGCTFRERTMGLDLVGYNHTDKDIGSFSVNGRGGAFVARHKGGGGFVCCASVPSKYQPGMTVTVGWTDELGENPQERLVEVPPYGPGDGSRFAVHFLRSGDIKVFVTSLSLRHPDYPLKGEEAKK